MFQCIIQQKSGWIHSPENRDVFPDIRQQLNEQLRCLDSRVDVQVTFVQELQDYFRKRAEIEVEYSKGLDKLAKSLLLRNKEQKPKRDADVRLFSSYGCWQHLIGQTKQLSKDHGTLSEIYSAHLVTRLQTAIEDVQRIYRKCREVAYETHEEILRVLQELHTTMKTYHNYLAESKAAEAKLKTAELSRMKLQQSIPKEKLERSKKYKLIEKEVLKRKIKYTDTRLKALKAKNEYQLCLEASNTTIHKYFVEDLSDLIDCMDLGFHSVVSRALLMHVTADQGRCRSLTTNAESLSHIIHAMDSRADKQKFLEHHHGPFMIPKRLELVHSGTSSSSSLSGSASLQTAQDEETMAIFHTIEPELQKALHQEMDTRLQLLEQRVHSLRTESEEIWKTLETAETNLLEILNAKDYDSSSYFMGPSLPADQSEVTILKQRADKQEIEDFYINKIREFMLGTSRITRLEAKAQFLRHQLSTDNTSQPSSLVKVHQPKRKRIGRMNMSGRPKLFGGSLEEYIEATGEEIPLIIRSCVRVINLYGLHHQGIFRVSGSQVEISNFREGFEKGEDPLAETTDASDINSVAGVLKLYLRELREPLFPIIYFDLFVSLAQLESKHEIVLGIYKFLHSLPRPIVIVIRYLFAFLNHLSEFSDENMMDAYNLAICFGPTLMPAPDDKEQVQYQNQVNDLIKNMIISHANLFSCDMGGTEYEKYISRDMDIDVGDSPVHDQVSEDADSEVCPSEDESDTIIATVQFDFNARSGRELSLRKGETIILRKQVSNDWWLGSKNGAEGLVPDKYIFLRIKGEEKDRSGGCSSSSIGTKISSSDESVPTKRSNVTVNPSKKSMIKSGLSGTVPVADDCVQDAPLQSDSASKAGGSDANIDVQAVECRSESGGVLGSSINAATKTYSYHDELFEKSMDYLEECNHFQYEANAVLSNASNRVILRDTSDCDEDISLQHNASLVRYSDPEVFRKQDSSFNKEQLRRSQPEPTAAIPPRKFHTKSLSLSGNKILTNAGLNPANSTSQLFQQNRNLWEKRAESTQTVSVAVGGGSGMLCSRILSRGRIAPDLVIDLPSATAEHSDSTSSSSLSSQEELEGASDECTTNDSIEMNASASTTKNPLTISTAKSVDGHDSIVDHFVDQSQCTLKKNDKYLLMDKKAVGFLLQEESVMKEPSLKEVLHISEDSNSGTKNTDDQGVNAGGGSLTTQVNSTITASSADNKSPIPQRNTQRFVSQFADLNLTGGCSQPATLSQPGGAAGAIAGKPSAAVKPQLMRKPLVLPPPPNQTPEMMRKTDTGN